MVVMPSMWLFNIFMQALGPIVDMMMLVALCTGQFALVIYYTAAFFVLDYVSAVVALKIDGENLSQSLWLFWQRFFYRQFLYCIIIKAIMAAIRGGMVGWGKLARKDTVSLPNA